MEIREYEKDLFIAFCKNRYKLNGTFDEVLKKFNKTGDWKLWERYRDEYFTLLIDTAEDISRAVSVVVTKMKAYLFDMKGLSKVIKVFRPKPYSLSGGKKYR